MTPILKLYVRTLRPPVLSRIWWSVCSDCKSLYVREPNGRASGKEGREVLYSKRFSSRTVLVPTVVGRSRRPLSPGYPAFRLLSEVRSLLSSEVLPTRRPGLAGPVDPPVPEGPSETSFYFTYLVDYMTLWYSPLHVVVLPRGRYPLLKPLVNSCSCFFYLHFMSTNK